MKAWESSYHSVFLQYNEVLYQISVKMAGIYMQPWKIL